MNDSDVPVDPTTHAAAAAHLAACDADWAALIARVGPCALQPRAREPYEALVIAIAHQQLHARAAEAILGRLCALYPESPFPPPQALLDTEVERLRGCGFSAAKVASLRGIAEQTLAGVVPGGVEAAALADEALIERLTSLRGVGRWTVEMLLIFTLGRPDVLPVDDFGVREGWRLLKGLEVAPKPRELARLGEAWSPHRSVAAWYLWRMTDLAKATLVAG